MNEKIKELAEQAEEYANQFVYVQAIGFPGHKEKFNEKFAELIVRECISIVNNAERGGSNEIWDNAVKFVRRDLKEHFGVE